MSFPRAANYLFSFFLNTEQITLLLKARSIHDIKKKVMGLCSTLSNFMKEVSIALLAFLDNLKDALYNCSIFEEKMFGF